MSAMMELQFNDSQCFSNDMDRVNCMMNSSDTGKLDTVAGIRIVSSLLGFLGASTILGSSVAKRRVFSPEVHPIFMLSLVDCMLAVLWIAGSALWFSPTQSYSHVWCYAVTLMTAILECVSINLTIVYAVLTFRSFKGFTINNLLYPGEKKQSAKFPVLSYIIAWLVPLVTIMIVFGVISGATDLLKDTTRCSCWCVPTVVNIVPFALTRDNATKDFVNRQFQFLLGIWSITFVNYIFGFIALSVLYHVILRKIKKYQTQYEDAYCNNESLNQIISKGQTEAKKRLILFLTVFTSSGLFNVLVTACVMALVIRVIVDTRQILTVTSPLFISLLYAQSITVPLQGFMNAIVYGWTRDDFVSTLDVLNNRSSMLDGVIEVVDNGSRLSLSYAAIEDSGSSDYSPENSIEAEAFDSQTH